MAKLSIKISLPFIPKRNESSIKWEKKNPKQNFIKQPTKKKDNKRQRRTQTYIDKTWVEHNLCPVVQNINNSFSDSWKPLDSLLDGSSASWTCHSSNWKHCPVLWSLQTRFLCRNPFRVLRHRRIMRPWWQMPITIVTYACQCQQLRRHVRVLASQFYCKRNRVL